LALLRRAERLERKVAALQDARLAAETLPQGAFEEANQ
jgi:hypothetical protein